VLQLLPPCSRSIVACPPVGWPMKGPRFRQRAGSHIMETTKAFRGKRKLAAICPRFPRFCPRLYHRLVTPAVIGRARSCRTTQQGNSGGKLPDKTGYHLESSGEDPGQKRGKLVRHGGKLVRNGGKLVRNGGKLVRNGGKLVRCRPPALEPAPREKARRSGGYKGSYLGIAAPLPLPQRCGGIEKVCGGMFR
jgi:hypothetical protein